MTRKKTIEQLDDEIACTKRQFQLQNVDLQLIRSGFDNYERARKYLSRFRDRTRRVDVVKLNSIMESNRNHYQLYFPLSNLIKKRGRRLRELQQKQNYERNNNHHQHHEISPSQVELSAPGCSRDVPQSQVEVPAPGGSRDVPQSQLEVPAAGTTRNNAQTQHVSNFAHIIHPQNTHENNGYTSGNRNSGNNRSFLGGSGNSRNNERNDSRSRENNNRTTDNNEGSGSFSSQDEHFSNRTETDNNNNNHCKCDNCHRKQFETNNNSYKLIFHRVNSNNFRKKGAFKLLPHGGNNEHTLCQECNDYLIRNDDSPKSCWPSLLWILMTGKRKSLFLKNKYFCKIYSPTKLWKFIPISMRKWWVETVKSDFTFRNCSPYSSVTVESPRPIFVDRTIEYQFYLTKRDSNNFKDVMDSCRMENIINRCNLCPFGCSFSVENSGFIDLDIMLQKMLPFINLPLFNRGSNVTDASAFGNVLYSYIEYFQSKDSRYPNMMTNPKWKIKPALLLDDKGLHALSCIYHNRGRKKLTLFPPKSPYGHIMNAKRSDQLCHCVKIPRISKPVVAKKYCTKFSMVQSRSGYTGVDSMNITTHSDFNFTSELLSQHESASIIGRKDISLLLSQKVRKGQLSTIFAEEMVETAKKRFTLDHLRKCAQGSTYVRFEDMIAIQLYESSENQQICIVDSNQREMFMKRSWPITINVLKTEDQSGFGTQFDSIPPFTRATGSTVPLTWCMFSILSGCADLWKVIDQKKNPFFVNSWEGHLLTAVNNYCFTHFSVSSPHFSPFKKKPISKIIMKLGQFVPQATIDRNDGCGHFRFDFGCFHKLFIPEFDDVISVVDSEELMEDEECIEDLEKKKIIIMVGEKSPSCGTKVIGNATFELRVFCILRSKSQERYQRNFHGIRYVRHGNGDDCWWKQEKDDQITTKCTNKENIYNDVKDRDNYYFHQCVGVYVKLDNTVNEEWKSKFFKSMGGKDHVRCQCCNFPLIPTNKYKDAKQKCNLRRYLNNGIVEEVIESCNKKEKYVCSNVNCELRICNECYKNFPEDEITICMPVTENNDNDSDYDSISNESHSSDDSNVMEMFNDTTDVEVSDERNIVEEMANLVVSPEQDITLDQTEDNIGEGLGFETTHAGQLPVNIKQKFSGDIVSGHVLYNQMGVCTRRYNYRSFTGTSRERHIVQLMSLGSTVPGESVPVTQVEAMTDPRHFYIEAKNDSQAILGAQCLFIYTSKAHPYGFESPLMQARIHMSNPFSTTSSDLNHMSSYFDQIGCNVLNHCNSRDIFSRGFVVDDSSPNGIDVRDKDHTKLDGAVSSDIQVRRLGVSAKYIAWGAFLTFTCNQSQHPGTAHLYEWKESMEWTKSIPGYDDLPVFVKNELIAAFEQVYGVEVFNNWDIAKRNLIRHIRDRISVLGTCTAIFARDEYQKDAGNLCHNHMIIAIDRSTMNDDTQKYIEQLISTHVFDLGRPEDMQRLIDSGLLTPEFDQFCLRNLGMDFLNHKCNDRCLMRIGPGDGPENFRCRKMHSYKDNPDPTKHSYVPFNIKFQDTTLKIFEELELYIPPEDEHGVGTFLHDYLKPCRHIGPCPSSATCNMSPVVVDFFAGTLSMQNIQVLAGTNGVTKYVTKYISKVDDGNMTLLLQDIHTGEFILGKIHLHNTKIVRSKINEDAAFQRNRNKNHPRGRDWSHFEIRQLLLGIPEVTTNLDYIDVPTVPFELRSKNSVSLDSSGNVTNPNQRLNSNNSDENDNHVSDPFMKVKREEANFNQYQRMTESQLATHRNHNGKSAKYDMISQFSLRPPELFSVFGNPVFFYRYCHVETKPLKVEVIEDSLSEDLMKCRWIDCFGRHVRIRSLAFTDVLDLIEKNMRSIQDRRQIMDEEEVNFSIEMNNVVKTMIFIMRKPVNQMSIEENTWFGEHSSSFFHSDSKTLLPIPVVSMTSPTNSLQFITHIILSLGNYKTEIDALSHPSFRECFKMVDLIGVNDDEESLIQYSRNVSKSFFKEQLVFYPNPMFKTESFIVLAKTLFDDIIIKNILPINELPPFTMNQLREVVTEKNKQFWIENNECQLHAIYSVVADLFDVPEKESVLNASKNNPLEWNPLDVITQFSGQSIESFNEQRFAMKINMRQINKYTMTSGEHSRSYTKNCITFGAPGTGKSFVGEVLVMYCISQGLKVVTSAIMSVRANALGGLHLHKLFCFPPVETGTKMPTKVAEYALERIRKNDLYLHVILTVDVIFFDEVAQVSAEQLSALDIILRDIRGSNIPFGGALILGTMDHTQIQPIQQMPFLTSTLVMTCFVAVELIHSVRAHNDPEFQRLQEITRMSPDELKDSDELRNEFFELASRILTFVDDWKNQLIEPNMTRCYARKILAKNELNKAREGVKEKLQRESVEFFCSVASDKHRSGRTNAEYSQATQKSIDCLNKELKEPEELLFFRGCLYECTQNDLNGDSRVRYSQSQICMMYDLPSVETINRKDPIPMLIAPPGTQTCLVDYNNIPSKQSLLDNGWKEVFIGTAAQQEVNATFGLKAIRSQYALRHIGAITVNKAQGQTLIGGLAVEITRECSPWEKGQIVVALSRTTCSEKTIIVGEKGYALKKMWEVITQTNQWFKYSEHVLKLIKISNNNEENENNNVFDFPAVNPYRMNDINTIPTDASGFIYCMLSNDKNDIIIGETQCLAQRIILYNSGARVSDTFEIIKRPWSIASYICGLHELSVDDRVILKRKWNEAVQSIESSRNHSIFEKISAGKIVVDQFNELNPNDKIHFVLNIVQEQVE